MRMTTRCFKALEKVEEGAPADQQETVHKETGAKQVYVEKVCVGYSEYGRWKWTQAGIQHLRPRGAYIDAATHQSKKDGESWILFAVQKGCYGSARLL